jgi:hypothetical protein
MSSDSSEKICDRLLSFSLGIPPFMPHADEVADEQKNQH